MTHFDEMSRWMGWSKNEFSHSLVLQHLTRMIVRLAWFRVHCFFNAQPAQPRAR